MFFDLLKALGTVVAVLSEVLKLETEAVLVPPHGSRFEEVVPNATRTAIPPSP